MDNKSKSIFAKKVNEKFSLALYLIMGWLVIFIIPQIIGQTGPVFWGLMLAGGLCYTVGAGFYAKKKPYFHMIWHLFILAASALQYLAIVYFMWEWDRQPWRHSRHPQKHENKDNSPHLEV